MMLIIGVIIAGYLLYRLDDLISEVELLRDERNSKEDEDHSD